MRATTMLRPIIALLTALTTGLAAAELTSPTHVFPLGKKKLIECPGDPVHPAYLRDHLQEMETRPFDGCAIQLPIEAGGGKVFYRPAWRDATDEAKVREAAILAAIPASTTLTDRFLILYGGADFDWFSDEDWAVVDAHLRWCARTAKDGHLKGVIWDPEPYPPGKNPWRMEEQPEHGQRGFPATATQARKRGAQFIKALQEEFPGIVIFSYRQLSDYQDGSPFSNHFFPISDPVRAEKDLGDTWFALHVPFNNGMLDGIASGTRLIDGNEDAYYYTSALEYYRLRHALKDFGRVLVAPENRLKFAAQYEIGQAISTDYCAGNWSSVLTDFPPALRYQAQALSPEERARWFEHNVYYALHSSDEYAWLYSERFSNWWTGAGVPPGFEDGLRRARAKVDAGKPLGFSIDQLLEGARRKATTMNQEK